MNRILLTLCAWGAISLAAGGAESLPYYNPGADLSSVVTQGHGTKVWETYSLTVGNPSFRIAPVNTTTQCDAWLWTPELAFETGKDYEIIVSSRVQRSNGTLAFEVYACNDASASAGKQLMTTHENITTTMVPYSVYWHCDDASKKRIGFHNICKGNHNFFYLDDITVREINGRVPAPGSLSATNPSGKNVTVTVTAPTLDILGLPLTTITRLELIHSGHTVMSWDNVSPGSVHEFSEIVNCVGPQTYTLVGYTGHDAGKPASCQVTVGGDANNIKPTLVNQWNPVTGAIYKARATYVPGTGCVLTWDAVEEEGVTYSVTRVQDGAVLATGLTACTYTDAAPLSDQLALYTYKIKKNVGGTESDLYTSTSLSLHNATPFESEFSEMALYEYSLYDFDTYDNETWRFASTISATYHDRFIGFNARCNDDLLVTPGIDLEAGKAYRVDVELLSNSIVESMVGFEMVMGDANNPEALTTTLIPYNMFNSLMAVPYQIYLNPTEDRQVFFGIRAKNPTEEKSYNDIALTRFAVTEVSQDLPGPVDNLHVTFAADDATQATLHFTAPSANVVGGPLEHVGRIDVTCEGQTVQTISSPLPGQELTCAVTLPLGTMKVYTVTPYTSDGEAGQSASIDVFIINPPYTNTFDDKSSAAGFKIECAYITGYSWGFQAQAMRAFPSDGILDDYLFTPPLHLEGGKYYKVDFLTHLGRDNTDTPTTTVELLLGNTPTIAGMETTVVDPYLVTGGFTNKVLVKNYFTVPETGEYYLGWHAYSPGGADELYIDDIHISDKIQPDVPGVVTDFEIRPESEGALSADIVFKLPTLSISGQPLNYTVSKYEIYRDGSLVKAAVPTATETDVTFHDTGMTEGVHLYTVICYKDNNTKGRELENVAWVGLNRPGPVQFVEAVEYDDTPGRMHITWGAPEEDIYGFKLNTTNITYTVGRLNVDMATGEYSETIYAQGITDLELDVNALAAGEQQQFMRFLVRPYTARGASPTTMLTNWISVGAPLEMPVRESFANSRATIMTMAQRTGDGSPAQWGFNTQNPVTNVGPVDGDNGVAMLESLGIGGGSRLFSGRIRISGEHPQLSFYVYNQTRNIEDINQLAIQLREGNGEFYTIATKSVKEWTGGKKGWQKAVVDLTPYIGKVVYIGFDATCVSHTFTHIDNVYVSESPAVDMAALSLEHPEVLLGLEHDVTVNVKNNGISASGDYTISLMLGHETMQTISDSGLAAGETREYVIPNTLGRENVGQLRYYAVVAHDNDGDLIDNTVKGATFYMADNNFPGVTNLMAQENGSSMELSWSAPVLPTQAVQVTDDFESYIPWSTMTTGYLGNWTLLDLDKGYVGGFESWDMPNVPMYSQQSFYLMDTSDEKFTNDNRYRAHSGNLVLVSSYNYDGQPTDDVLLSPELSGEAQTISFWARGLGEYPEWFQVRYSTTDTMQSSFERVDPETYSYQADGNWTLYTFDLPEGARYFEIEHYSNTGYFFFVDDITYTPAGDERLTLTGYNVYHDGVKTASSPAEQTVWTHQDVEIGNHTYAVSALYDRGESPAVEISAISTGLNARYAEAASVRGTTGHIEITGAAGRNVTVSNPAGLVVTSFRADAAASIPVAAGVYIVTVGDSTYKVVVK